jgi:hypothetical protein
VALRLQRQEILDDADTVSLHFVIDEATMHRIVGGPDLMRRQLAHLQDVATRPNVTLRVMSYNHGIYPRLGVAYVLFEFPDAGDEEILFIENPQGDLLIREATPGDSDDVAPAGYLEVFFQLEQLARSQDSPALIDAARAGLPHSSVVASPTESNSLGKAAN